MPKHFSYLIPLFCIVVVECIAITDAYAGILDQYETPHLTCNGVRDRAKPLASKIEALEKELNNLLGESKKIDSDRERLIAEIDASEDKRFEIEGRLDELYELPESKAVNAEINKLEKQHESLFDQENAKWDQIDQLDLRVYNEIPVLQNDIGGKRIQAGVELEKFRIPIEECISRCDTLLNTRELAEHVNHTRSPEDLREVVAQTLSAADQDIEKLIALLKEGDIDTFKQKFSDLQALFNEALQPFFETNASHVLRQPVKQMSGNFKLLKKNIGAGIGKNSAKIEQTLQRLKDQIQKLAEKNKTFTKQAYRKTAQIIMDNKKFRKNQIAEYYRRTCNTKL